MKTQNIFLAITITICSCQTKKKEHMADNRGPNDGKEIKIINAKKDTINVFEYIAIENGRPRPEPDGAPREEILSEKIIKYDDSNKDTIIATIEIKGIVHPPPLGKPQPDKPFERMEHYKFYKVKGAWSANAIIKP